MATNQETLIAGRYRILGRAGQGGMGRVWHARDEVLGRDVALKELVPPPGLSDDEQQAMRTRSMREARALARVNHPNAVKIFDVVRPDDGDPWIVMEYVTGRSLQQVLDAEGPLPVPTVARIGLGVLAALAAGHRAGVVHRDVKPGNVLLADDGRVVLTDFGLATVPGDPHVTQTGQQMFGSPAFMAPERAVDGTAGNASDLWSLGATLYSAVEGHPPYPRPTAIATLTALASEPVPTPKHAGALKNVLAGLLRKDPAKRLTAIDAERLLRKASGRSSAGSPNGTALWVNSGEHEQVPPAVSRTAIQPAVSGMAAAGPAVAGAAVLPGAQPSPVSGTPPAQRPSPDAAIAAAPLAQQPTRVPGTPPAEQSQPPGTRSAQQPSQPPGTPPAQQASPAPGTPPGQRSPAPGIPPAQQPNPAPGAPAAQQSNRASGAPPARQSGAAAVVVPAQRSKPAPTVAKAPVPSPTSLPAAGGAPVRPAMRRRGAVLAVAGASVVALLLLVALLIHGTGGPSAGPAKASAPASAAMHSAAATPSATASSASPSPSPAPSTTPSGFTLPAGWSMRDDGTGFHVPVPDGWTAGHDSDGRALWRSPDHARLLLIDQSRQPKPDPLQDWQNNENARKSGYQNYHRVRLESVDYWDKAADWEFTYTLSGTATHVLNRGFITAPDQAYSIYFSTPDAQWADAQPQLQTILAGFQPARSGPLGG